MIARRIVVACVVVWWIAGPASAQSPPSYSVTPVLFVPTPSSFPAGYQPTTEQLNEDMANIATAVDRIRVWYGEALGLETSFKVQPAVYMAAWFGLSGYGIVWTNPQRRYSDGISLDQGVSTWGSVTAEVRARGYSPGSSSAPRMIVIFCKGAGGFAGGAQWYSAHGGGMCMLGDWCLDSLADRVPPQDWSWWTGVDLQTAATGHEMGHTIGMPHPDLANPVTGQQDWAYTLMGWWWDWPNYGTNPADPTWPLHGLHAWADNAGPSGSTPDYQDEFLLAYRAEWFVTSIVDPDGDGLPDAWEMQYFGNLSHNGSQDEEPDGLTNLLEYQNGTNPLDPDSDDDGLTDGYEVLTFGSDPNDPDSDDDGLTDGAEATAGTDPNDPDSDGDQMPDGWEVAFGLNPLVNDAAADPDNDGYANLEEFEGDSDPMRPWSIPPVVGYALSFDGANDFADLGNVSVAGPQLTVEAWVYPRVSGSARILEKLEDYGVHFTGNNVVRFMTKHGFTWDNLDGQTPNSSEQWVHVACVLDGSHKSIYVNGQPDAQGAYTYDVKVTTNPLIVGASSPGASEGFIDAVVDEVRVWSIARTQEQIEAAMNSGLSGGETGLVGYWNLNEGSGQIAFDLAGEHDGRLGSSAGPDDADPAWVESPAAPGLGPAILAVARSTAAGSTCGTLVTADISEAGTGNNGVASATLYYGYAWPFNADSVIGSGPGGSGDGTWTFVVPAQGHEHQGQVLSFFVRATDGLGNSSFQTNSEALFTVGIRLPGDSDGDGDADLDDYAEFADCLTGPEGGLADPPCGFLDCDADADVDLEDFGRFQTVFSQP